VPVMLGAIKIRAKYPMVLMPSFVMAMMVVPMLVREGWNR
jgi:hypothetical protein